MTLEWNEQAQQEGTVLYTLSCAGNDEDAIKAGVEAAMSPLADKRRQRSGVKVRSKRMFPHQDTAIPRARISRAKDFIIRGGAASSTMWNPDSPVSWMMRSMSSASDCT